MRKNQPILHWALSFGVIVIIWELVSFCFRDVPMIFPRPTEVLFKVFQNRERFIFHSAATLFEMLTGILIATSFAFPTAYFMYKFKTFKSIVEPMSVIFQCVPMFTLAPVFIIWFGWSIIAVIIPTAMMITFPLTMSIYKGLLSTPKKYEDFFKMHGASKLAMLVRLKLPFASSQIFSGFRITSAIAGIGAIAGEWAGAQKGLGVYIQMCRRDFDLVGVFGSIFCLLIMSLSLYGIVIAFEKLTFRGSYEKFKTSQN